MYGGVWRWVEVNGDSRRRKEVIGGEWRSAVAKTVNFTWFWSVQQKIFNLLQ